MTVRFLPGKLRAVKGSEYLSRFVWGCGLTLLFSLVTKWAGPVIGGLFLAFPGIFPPGVSLVEKKATEKKMEAGVQGTRQARALASVNAAGASSGAIGLAVFAAVLWLGLPHAPLLALAAVALLLWLGVAAGAWWVRERI